MSLRHPHHLIVSASVVAFAIGVFVACSTETVVPGGSGTSSSGGSSSGDSGPSTKADGAIEEEEEDAGQKPKDAGADVIASTEQTSVDVTLNDVKRTLVRAQFGTDTLDAGGTTIRLEAHEGGDPACPDESSPTPKRTMIIANIPRGEPGAVFTKAADKVAVTIIDFENDQLPVDDPIARASAATITIVKIAPNDTSVELLVDATFPQGTVKGRVYATYCESLSD